MAFDDKTRKKLSDFVTDVRRTLEGEFTRQLQSDYGLDPISGMIAPPENLRHLNDQQRETGRILRETLAHYCASPETDIKSGLERIVREQAFTILNRLAAMRMAEARGILIESVGNGYQAKGFQLYYRLAGAGLGETGDAYRVYLQSMFDELSQDLPGLFQRFSPEGRLFPRDAALIEVLKYINDSEIELLWGEDETIGWIYQYFNSREERKAMREASHAPRNSRELAVRNQFFTPRYVVEFLVDNTLGRLWLNWTNGNTSLRDRCRYLLVKPGEKPEPPVRLRDPRTIKLLDPACGSMHFGLYAFDLFLEIYREAWEWEETHGPGWLDTETEGLAELKPLCQTYADKAAFQYDVPRLIIECNIYGVDIDPRATQIASLALWLRAQRAWHEAGVKARDRPEIGRGHVVAAVAPPAELELRQRFMEELDPLDAELFEQTLFLLKGLPELGVLLQVELELPSLIRKVYGEHGPMFQQTDMAQWQRAETRLRIMLSDFARAAQSTYQGRLFAQDALEGLRLIDLAREHFDVIVMNPPFGLPSPNARTYIDQTYLGAQGDIYSSFVRRAMDLSPNGFVGCITSSSFLLSPRLEEFRKRVLSRLSCVADCGLGVMDDAMVRSAIYVLEKQGNDLFLGANVKPYLNEIKLGARPALLKELFETMEKQSFFELPQSRLLISAPPHVRSILAQGPFFEPTGGTAREGMKTFDNERFIRLPWEVSESSIGQQKDWRWLSKGGEFAFFYSEIRLVLNWRNDGAELKEFNILLNGSTSQVRQASTYWGLPGATYSKRSSGFSARILPEGCIFTSMGPAVLPLNDTDPIYMLGWLNSRLIRALTHLNAGAYDNYTTGALKRLPWQAPKAIQADEVNLAVGAAVISAKRLASLTEECSRWFIEFPIRQKLREVHDFVNEIIEAHNVAELYALDVADRVVADVYGLSELQWTEALLSKALEDEENVELPEDEIEPTGNTSHIAEEDIAYRMISYLVGLAFGRWSPKPDLTAMVSKELENPLSTPPATQPGSLASASCTESYPTILSTEDHGEDSLPDRIRRKAGLLVQSPDSLEQELLQALNVQSISQFLDEPKAFFSLHLMHYTDSKRQAPIYWPLSTPSGSYTLWVYYPRLTSQTLYTAINDFVEPKLSHLASEVAMLRTKASTRTREDEKTFETLQGFELELGELRDKLLEIATIYRPNSDDGVQITAAPLWSLFRHRSWQAILKETWAKLEKGDYDWSHLAMHYWPERVRNKCKTDKSLAIAHGLEELYIEPLAKPKKTRGRKNAGLHE